MKFYTYAERYGNNILHRWIEKDHTGKVRRFEQKEPYEPTLYIPGEGGEFKDLRKNPLVAVEGGRGMKEATEYARDLRHSQIEVFGQPRYQFAFLDDTYAGASGIEADHSLVEAFNIDIEVEQGEGFPKPEEALTPINAITIHSRLEDHYYVYSTLPYKNTDKQVTFKQFSDEEDLLLEVINLFKDKRPNIITGWNVKFFDIPYIVNRVKKVLGNAMAKQLSPFGIVSEQNVEDKYKKIRQTFEFAGICVLDYIDLYKKYTYGQPESYKLDHIAELELDEKKLDHSEYETFKEFYTKNPQKYIEYNIHDARLVKRIDDKLGFIDLAMTIAYRSKTNYTDVFAQVAMWDALTMNFLKGKKKIIGHFDTRGGDGEDFAGGYVKHPLLGLYEWILSFDFASLYPSLIMAFNISPEKLLGMIEKIDIERFIQDREYQAKIMAYAKAKKVCVAANGATFDADEPGFLPQILEEMYAERKAQKKVMLRAKKLKEGIKALGGAENQTGDWMPTILPDLATLEFFEGCPEKWSGLTGSMQELLIECCDKLEVIYDAKQMATKINLNSCFGVLGNEYFRWFDLAQAEAITLTGQLAIQWIAARINEWLANVLKNKKDRVIAVDTDSVVGDTLVWANGVQIPISELYEQFLEFEYQDDFNKNYVKPAVGVVTRSMNNLGELEERPVSYVMKHTVKKRMYRITVGDKSVIVTEDHSVIVKRAGEYKCCAPNKLKSGDEVICIHTSTDTDTGATSGSYNCHKQIPKQ